MQIVNGCRGIIELQFDVIGKSAHAGRPDLGTNAIERAVSLVQEFKVLLARYENEKLGSTTVNLSRLEGGKLQNDKIITQGNAVPDIARILLDIRPSSELLTDTKIIKMLINIGKKSNVKLSNIVTNISYPAYFLDMSTTSLSIDRYINRPYRKDLGSGGFYEAALFANAWKCPAISFGPGDARSSHTQQERVNLQDLKEIKETFKKLLLTYRV